MFQATDIAHGILDQSQKHTKVKTMWFLVSGALLYGGLYPNPTTAPIEVHVFFFGTTLAAFYIIPTTIYHRFKRLKHQSRGMPNVS